MKRPKRNKPAGTGARKSENDKLDTKAKGLGGVGVTRSQGTRSFRKGRTGGT